MQSALQEVMCLEKEISTKKNEGLINVRLTLFAGLSKSFHPN